MAFAACTPIGKCSPLSGRTTNSKQSCIQQQSKRHRAATKTSPRGPTYNTYLKQEKAPGDRYLKQQAQASIPRARSEEPIQKTLREILQTAHKPNDQKPEATGSQGPQTALAIREDQSCY